MTQLARMAPQPNRMSAGERLRNLADELITLDESVDQPSRSTTRSDMLTAEGERISQDVWAVFRARG